MIKAREVRKELMKNPQAKPLHLAKKYNMMLTDIYLYRKQVREALAGKQGVSIDKNGVYLVDLGKTAAEKPKLGRPKKVLTAKAQSATIKVAASQHKLDLAKLDHYIGNLIAQHQLDFKVGYAVRLLVTNKKKEALEILTAE